MELYTDAMNLFELVVHRRARTNDKYHRVGILALREDRITRRLRHIVHLPTNVMLADPSTTNMLFPVFMMFATTGIWFTEAAKVIRIRRAGSNIKQYTEKELMSGILRNSAYPKQSFPRN
jgi:hypothetical protein